ncbi:hypothetical protein C2G38_2172960 [Gigaspora rosea]|uniref:Uncharacterized protein n=1 Tax=Gigaspora rosea TaxID=44941 RepID=A0A397VK10_9GLOM|nr:hypothetical protein C2G38_2172960 [Gigaspora rosea]
MQGSFNCGDFVKYYSKSGTIEVGYIRSFVIVDKKIATRIQRLFSYKQDLSYLYSKQCASHSSQELYLVEESEPTFIDPSSLICCLNVWLQDQPVLVSVNFLSTKYYIITMAVLFGGKLRDFIKGFIEEVQQLEQGFIMNVNSVNHWISDRLAMVMADLPQGKDIASVLHHNANFRCCSCRASKNELTDIAFDVYFNRQYIK